MRLLENQRAIRSLLLAENIRFASYSVVRDPWENLLPGTFRTVLETPSSPQWS
jgi:hypothetical protein